MTPDDPSSEDNVRSVCLSGGLNVSSWWDSALFILLDTDLLKMAAAR